MADAQRSGRCGSNPVEVQVLSSAPSNQSSEPVNAARFFSLTGCQGNSPQEKSGQKFVTEPLGMVFS